MKKLLIGLLLIGISGISGGASIIITDPNCVSFAATGTTSTLTLSCTGTTGTPVTPPPVTPPPVTPPPVTPPPVVSGVPTACGAAPVVFMGDVPAFTSSLWSTGFGANQIAIARLIVPAGYPTSTAVINVFEVEGGGTWRKVWMSQTACDMSATAPPYFTSSGNRPNIPFTIGGADVGAVRMQPGQVWYLMVANQKMGTTVTSCSKGTCNIGISWGLPK
jgi:hypothetical protein